MLKLEDRILKKAKAQGIVSELISLGHGHVVGDHPGSIHMQHRRVLFGTK